MLSIPVSPSNPKNWFLLFLQADREITFFLKNTLATLLLPLTKLLPPDQLFNFFSFAGNSVYIWIVIIILALVLEERKYPGISKKDIKFISLFFISFVTASILSQIIIKNLIQRPRPCYNPLNTLVIQFPRPDQRIRNETCPTDYSFPSSHATTAFAAATVLTFFDKKRRYFYFLIAIVIALSRVYLGYHYLLDIVAGAFLGYLTSKIVLKSAKSQAP